MSQQQNVQEVELNEENALKLLHALLEKAQRGKAITNLSDAALIHRSLMFLMKKPEYTSQQANQNPELTPESALEVVGQGIDLGQKGGAFGLEEAYHAVTIVRYLVSKFRESAPAEEVNDDTLDKEEDKGKAPSNPFK